MRDLGLLLLRLGVGLTLMAHGSHKLFGGGGKEAPERLGEVLGPNFRKAWAEQGPDEFAGFLTSLNVPNPKVAAYLSGLAEFGGGLAIAAGFKPWLAGPAVIFNLGVAIRKVHWQHGFYGQQGYEHAALLALATAALMLTGPGKIALHKS